MHVPQEGGHLRRQDAPLGPLIQEPLDEGARDPGSLPLAGGLQEGGAAQLEPLEDVPSHLEGGEQGGEAP